MNVRNTYDTDVTICEHTKEEKGLEQHGELYLLTQKLSVIPVTDISSTTLSSVQVTYSGE